MNPKSTDYEADALTTTPSRRFVISLSFIFCFRGSATSIEKIFAVANALWSIEKFKERLEILKTMRIVT